MNIKYKPIKYLSKQKEIFLYVPEDDNQLGQVSREFGLEARGRMPRRSFSKRLLKDIINEEDLNSLAEKTNGIFFSEKEAPENLNRKSFCGEKKLNVILAEYASLSKKYRTVGLREGIKIESIEYAIGEKCFKNAPDLRQDASIMFFHLNWSSYKEKYKISQKEVLQFGKELDEIWYKLKIDFLADFSDSELSKKIEVYFCCLDTEGKSNLGGVFFDVNFLKTNSEIRRLALFTHELFHQVQYFFGYRKSFGKNTDKVGYKWFSEGLASWAEIAYQKFVDNYKSFEAPFINSDQGFFERDYDAVSFWFYFSLKNREIDKRSILNVLQKCKVSNDPKKALFIETKLRIANENESEIKIIMTQEIEEEERTNRLNRVNENLPDFDTFFLKFCVDRLTKKELFQVPKLMCEKGITLSEISFKDKNYQIGFNSFSEKAEFITSFGVDYFKIKLDKSIHNFKIIVTIMNEQKIIPQLINTINDDKIKSSKNLNQYSFEKDIEEETTFILILTNLSENLGEYRIAIETNQLPS